MATSIEIPEEALADLKKVSEPDDDTFHLLLSVIRETPPTLNPRQFRTKIADRVQALPATDVQSILRTAFNLYEMKFRPRHPLSAKDLAEGVTNSSVVSRSPEFSPEKKKTLSERLALLLSLDGSLGVTSKALDVMTEHERVFCGARILSDIRPVFSATPEVAAAGTIIHNLQIGFHQDGRHHDFYVALDADDLGELKRVIERAEKKAAALRSILSQSKTTYLEV